MPCSVFLDNEATHSGRRQLIEQQIVAHVWTGTVNIEEATCKWVSVNGLFELLGHAEQASGIPVRYLEDQIYQGIPEANRRNTPRDLRTSGYEDEIIRRAFYVAMHNRSWFKSREGGRILARALSTIGMPQEIQEQLMEYSARLRPFIS